MPGFRMFEAQYMGMKGLAIKPGQGVAGVRAEQRRLGLESGPIDAIADERMADMGEMYPDLVGPARFQPAGKQARDGIRSGAEIAFRHLPVRDGMPAALPHRHLVARMGMPGDFRLDPALGPVRRAPHEAEIAALERAGATVVGELGGERPMRRIGLGHDQEAGGILVEPVDDAGPFYPADAGQAVAAMGDQGVTSVPVQFPAAGCTTSPAGLSITISSAS